MTELLRSDALVDLVTTPRGVVLVGASSDLAKPSGRSLDYLSRYGYEGAVQVVNPRRTEIAGFPCVASVADIQEGSADAAIVNLPASKVTPALRELDTRGVRASVVIGSGFEDPRSEARADLQHFLADPTRRMRVIGPNCVGTMSVASGAHLNFSSVLQGTAPRRGGAALVTQSGANGNGLLMSLLRRGAGISHWFSTGDELDVGSLELIAGLLTRDDVTAVGLFLEAITDVGWLPRVRDALEATGKRVFMVKVADSDLGQAAAGGHTGRVVGSSDISRAVLEQTGFVRVQGLDELADCLVAHEVVGALPANAFVAAVSVSGAGGVIIADQVRDTSVLTMPPFDADLSAEIGAITRNRVAATNPLDVPFLGETETFGGVVVSVSEWAGADLVIAVESSLAHDRATLAEMLLARTKTAAPVILSHLSEDDPISPDLVERLAEARVAVMPTPERAVRAAARLTASDVSGRATSSHAHPDDSAGRMAGLEEVAELFPSEFPWAPWRLVASESEVALAGAEFGFPLAIKAAGRTIAHRSELGAVEVVRAAAEFLSAYRRVAEVCEWHGDAVIVQQGVPSGHDLLVAVLRDPEYGVTAVIRPGGVLAEMLDEQVVLWHGWDAGQRSTSLRSSRIGTLLGGYRGAPPADVPALEDLIETVLASVVASDLEFVEFNPVVVGSDGAYVVDALASARATE